MRDCKGVRTVKNEGHIHLRNKLGILEAVNSLNLFHHDIIKEHLFLGNQAIMFCVPLSHLGLIEHLLCKVFQRGLFKAVFEKGQQTGDFSTAPVSCCLA